MKKLFLCAAVLLLTSCSVPDFDEERRQSMRTLIDESAVHCADGNVIRFAVHDIGGNGSAFTAWTVLNPDGTPMRCVEEPSPKSLPKMVPPVH